MQQMLTQAQIMSNFFDWLTSPNPLVNYTDAELMKLYHTAVDTQDSRNIHAIKMEMNRRNSEL